jgi:hypothetical protein
LNLRRTSPSHLSSGAVAGRRGNSKLSLRFFFLQIILFSSALSFPAVLPAQLRPSSEYELKAAFLFNFAKFVDWPPNSFAGPDAPFLVCVLGTDPFGGALDNALRGKVIAEHAASVSRIKRVADINGCQILFIAASESHLLPEVLAKIRGQYVLVIGESDDFASSGGAIQFTLEENRVRFFINPDAAGRAGLKISSKLLALAKIVRDAPATGKS